MSALNWIVWLIFACAAVVLAVAYLTLRELCGWSRDLDRFEKRLRKRSEP